MQKISVIKYYCETNDRNNKEAKSTGSSQMIKQE